PVHVLATAHVYTLSLPDALPILPLQMRPAHRAAPPGRSTPTPGRAALPSAILAGDNLLHNATRLSNPTARSYGPRFLHRGQRARSEEHTSELQSRENLVCRLLLE